MTTYYTYATKAYDYHGNDVLQSAWVNITEEDIMMATLKGKLQQMIEGYHYEVVKQTHKIANRGNKAQRWVSKVCKQKNLIRLHKADELRYSNNIGGIIIK